MSERAPLRYRCRSGAPSLVAALLVTLAMVSSQEARAQSRKDSSAAIRRVLLWDYLEPHRESAAIARYAPAVLGVVTLALGVGVGIGGVGEDPSGRSRWVIAGTGGAVAAVSFGSYALHADYRWAALDASLGLLVAGTGASFYVNSRGTDTSRFSSAAMMGTGLVYGALAVTDAALLRPVSSATLARHLERLEHGGDQVTSEEIARMERDFARTVRPIPRWTLSLTLGVGSLVAASPVFLKGTSQDDKEVSLVFSTILLTPALTSIPALVSGDRNSYGSYEQALRRVQLTPLGPAGSAGVALVSSPRERQMWR